MVLRCGGHGASVASYTLSLVSQPEEARFTLFSLKLPMKGLCRDSKIISALECLIFEVSCSFLFVLYMIKWLYYSVLDGSLGI